MSLVIDFSKDKRIKVPADYTRMTPQKRAEVRMQYVEDQKGKCYWCEESLDDKPPTRIRNQGIDWNLFPSNFLKYPVHLQHNHNTGMTEGAVHSYCNAVMWQYHGR